MAKQETPRKERANRPQHFKRPWLLFWKTRRHHRKATV